MVRLLRLRREMVILSTVVIVSLAACIAGASRLGMLQVSQEEAALKKAGSVDLCTPESPEPAEEVFYRIIARGKPTAVECFKRIFKAQDSTDAGRAYALLGLEILDYDTGSDVDIADSAQSFLDSETGRTIVHRCYGGLSMPSTQCLTYQLRGRELLDHILSRDWEHIRRRL